MLGKLLKSTSKQRIRKNKKSVLENNTRLDRVCSMVSKKPVTETNTKTITEQIMELEKSISISQIKLAQLLQANSIQNSITLPAEQNTAYTETTECMGFNSFEYMKCPYIYQLQPN